MPTASFESVRFMMKILIGYPEAEAERLMIGRMHRLGANILHPEKVVTPVLDTGQLVQVRGAAHSVEADESILNYIVEIVRNSRSLPSLSLGASPRAGVMLLRASKASALIHGKTYVTPDDVRDVALSVLRHRVRLTPEAEIEGLTADACLDSLLKRASVPR